MPAWVVLSGDVLVALGFLAVFFVFRENTFASATIEVEADQRTISTGPYALVLIVQRLLAEERFLAKNLPGYADYRSRVRYRLAPFVW